MFFLTACLVGVSAGREGDVSPLTCVCHEIVGGLHHWADGRDLFLKRKKKEGGGGSEKEARLAKRPAFL